MPDGTSFLHLAAKRGHVAVVEAIVSAHPNPATWHKFLMGCGALSELRALGAAPPAPNAPRNYLPRIYDAGQMPHRIWSFLEKPCYADLEHPDGDGRTALQVAEAEGKTEVAKVLRQWGAQG